MIILNFYFRSFLRLSRLIMYGQFLENLQSVQKCTQIKENLKNHYDLNFKSIWKNFISKYAQKLFLGLFVKKKIFQIFWY